MAAPISWAYNPIMVRFVKYPVYNSAAVSPGVKIRTGEPGPAQYDALYQYLCLKVPKLGLL